MKAVGSKFLLMGCCAIGMMNPVFAEKVPIAKPLHSPQQKSFLEGVDLPRAKPAIGRRETTSSPEQAFSCEISGALVEPLNRKDHQSTLERNNDKGCGIAKPVRFEGVVLETEILRFSAPIIVSCGFAEILSGWLREDVMPAARRHLKSDVSLLATGPGYQCRRRNNLPDGKLSEHALGKAIDISAFQLSDGSPVSIEEDWDGDAERGRFLNEIHKAACKRFTTVLGPAADPNHRSHFHLDIGCHGKDCTYVICQ